MSKRPDQSPTPGNPQGLAGATPKNGQSPHQAAFSTATFRFAVLLIAAFITTFLPLPFRMVAVGFSLAAAVWGTIVLVRFWKKDIAHSQLAVFVFGVIASLLMAAMTGSTAARWETEMNYQTCVSEAITQQSRTQCFTTYQNELKEIFSRPTQ